MEITKISEEQAMEMISSAPISGGHFHYIIKRWKEEGYVKSNTLENVRYKVREVEDFPDDTIGYDDFLEIVHMYEKVIKEYEDEIERYKDGK